MAQSGILSIIYGVVTITLIFLIIQMFYSVEYTPGTTVVYNSPIAQKIFPKLEFGNSLEQMYPYISSLNDHMMINKTNPVINSGWISK